MSNEHESSCNCDDCQAERAERRTPPADADQLRYNEQRNDWTARNIED